VQFFFDAFVQALKLLISLDSELYGIIFRSVAISGLATVFSALAGIPLGTLIAMHRFRGKRFVVSICNTLMGLPPVVVGLVVYMLLSNQMGIFGTWRLLFTPFAMLLAQFLLGAPIVTALTIVAITGVDAGVAQTAKMLGADRRQYSRTLIREARFAIGAAVIAGFGRLIAEVGAVMMVGGNIRFQTRVMTTAIALQKGMGEFEIALALGFILILLSFLITAALDWFRQGAGVPER
jgi:tungstate transport system permease protein